MIDSGDWVFDMLKSPRVRATYPASTVGFIVQKYRCLGLLGSLVCMAVNEVGHSVGIDSGLVLVF